MAKPCLAISMGDPAGIGPEVVAKALQNPSLRRQADFILVGNRESVPPALRHTLKGFAWEEVASSPWPKTQPSALSGRVAAESIRRAVKLVQSGKAHALVTAPISKEALALAGERFPGHTEMLAWLAGKKPDQVGMLLVGGGLRVFLVTRHVGLKKALASLSKKSISHAIELAGKGLVEQMGLPKPRLALAALNPHAGEAGQFGKEEIKLLEPVVRLLKKRQGFELSGPYPADTVFVHALRGRFDAVICLTHDQGLIPLKLLAFDSGVNVTLGLPFIRTSPDHGTAYDIAGKGIAKPDSFKAAVDCALEMIQRSRKAGR